MVDLELKQSEHKTVQFTITDSSADAVDVSGATSITFNIKKRKSDTAALVAKTATDFTVTSATAGVITVDLNSTDTNQTAGKYTGELTIGLSSTHIDKSDDFSIDIIKKVS